MRFNLILPIAVSLAACGLSHAQQPEEPQPGGKLSLETKRVVVFKDGHGLFVKEARGKADKQGKLFTDELPDQASLGSFWLSDREYKIASLVAARAEREQRETLDEHCQNVFEVLKANRGQRARVEVADHKTHQGVIRTVLERPVRDQAASVLRAAPVTGVLYNPLAGHGPTPAAGGPGERVEIRSPEGNMFVLGTDEGDLLLEVAAVRSLQIPKMRTTVTREKVTRRQVKLLTVEYQKPMAGRAHALDLMYFRPGIRWIPTYRVELGEAGTAELVMQAELLNEAEDFDDAAVDFVVGLPTFRFQDVASPLSMERVMVNALAQAAPSLGNQLAAQSFSNVAFNDRRGRARQAGTVAATGPDVAVSAMDGSEVQDLFYYSTRKLSLRRGERAAVEVLRAKAAYRHLYTWDVTLGRSAPDVHTGYRSPLKLTTNKVWHQVVLKNRSGRPWTTGPALMLAAGLPVGQDMLTFTPPGREVMVPLTAAVSVRGTVDEQELGRTHAARKIRSRSYTRVRNRAVFKVVNSLKTKVELVIQAQVSGKATDASDRGRVELVGGHAASAEDSLLNQQSRLTWELTLKPGEQKTVQADYHFFVRE